MYIYIYIPHADGKDLIPVLCARCAEAHSFLGILAVLPGDAGNCSPCRGQSAPLAAVLIEARLEQ